MRPLYPWSLALGLAVLLGGPALAQPGRGNTSLLLNKSVQEELKVDQAQIDKATEAFKKFDEDNKELLAKARDRSLSREDRAEAREKVAEARHKVAAGLLEPEQLKRLEQIQRQQEGVAAFARAQTQKALALDDKQKDELKVIAEGLRKESAEIRQKAGDNRAEAREKTAALRKEKMGAALKVLTDEQRKTWKGLTGEPFEVKRERPNP
jgi:hypothetical protein